MLEESPDAALQIGEIVRKLRLMEHETQRMTRELVDLAILLDEQRTVIAAQDARISELNEDRRRYRDKLRLREQRLKKTERNLQQIRQSRLWRWTEPFRGLRRLWVRDAKIRTTH